MQGFYDRIVAGLLHARHAVPDAARDAAARQRGLGDGRRPLADGEVLGVLESVGLVIIGFAIIETAKFIAEEEILRRKELRSAVEARRSLTKFITIIVIAASLEALVMIFETSRTDVTEAIYPAALFAAAMFALIALGAFQWLSSRIAPPPAGADGATRSTTARRRSRRNRRASSRATEGSEMEYRKLGNSGARRLGALPRHDDLRRGGRRGDLAPHHRRLRRGRRQLHRHRRRLQRRRLARRSSAAGSPRTRPRRAQMVVATKGRFPMGAGPNDLGTSRRHLAHGARRLAAAARGRADRPLPDARLGRADPARGDAALPRRRDQRRQDRLLRLLELPRLAASPRPCTSPARAAARRR